MGTVSLLDGFTLIIGADTEYVRASHLDGIPSDSNRVISYQACIYNPRTGARGSDLFAPGGQRKAHRITFGGFIGRCLASAERAGFIDTATGRLPPKVSVAVAAHFSRADLPGFRDFRRLKRLFTVTRGTYATIDRPAILDVPMPDGRRLRVSVVLYDTKLLAPASAGSLKALGELLGFPKLEVPPVVDEGGRTVAGITRMDIVASQHPDAFCAYAIRDAEIAVDWLLKVADFADAWGLVRMPRTVASMGVARLRRDAEAELPAIVGRGVKPSGALGDYLPEALAVQGIAADAYHGGRNEASCTASSPAHSSALSPISTLRAPTPTRSPSSVPSIGPPSNTPPTLNGSPYSSLSRWRACTLSFRRAHGSRASRSTPTPTASSTRSKGTTTVPGPELVVALSQGARIIVRAGVVAPWLDPNSPRPFVDYARLVNRTRACYPKGSPLELLAKEAGNSLYGKTGQGVGEMKTAPAKRRVFDSRSGESRPLPPSRITCPIVAAHTSGLPRAVLSEILSLLPPHVRVLSATTDGWLSDATEEEARAAASGPVCRHFARLRALVDPAGSDEILEVKHRALTVLVAKTRHGITITPVPGSKLICARAGHRLPEDAPSPEAETAEWVRIQRERTYSTNLPRRQFISPRDQWHRDGDLVDYYREVRVSLDYDMKRAPIAPRDSDGLINFTTEPWTDVEAFKAARGDLDRWQSATRSVLKTSDDWIRFQQSRVTPRTRSAGRRTPFQQAILVAWSKGLPGFPIRRGRGRGGTGPIRADIARILTEAGVPEATHKVLEKARANEADPTGTVTTLADCDHVAMTYLADHLPPEAIQSVLAEGLKTPLAANPSELVHMGNAPTISPAPDPTEITDENTYSDDVQTQMPQTGWGEQSLGHLRRPSSNRPAMPPRRPLPNRRTPP